MSNGVDWFASDDSIEIDVAPLHLARFGVFLVAAGLVVGAIGRAQELLGLVVIAAVLASLIAPVVRRVARLVGTVGATILVHLALFILVVSLTAVMVQEIRATADALESFTEAQLDAAEQAGGLSLSSRARLAQQLSSAVADWGTVAVVGEEDAVGIAARASQLAVAIVLSIFFSLQGQQLLDTAMRATEDRDRRRWLRELWHSSVHAAAALLRRTVLFAALTGAAAGAVAATFDLPGVMLIGFWAALVSAVPLLGSPSAWAPVVVLAVLNLSPGAALGVTAIALVAIATSTMLRARYDVPFQPGNFVVTVGIAAGLSAAGIPGAVAGLFLAVGVAFALAQDHTNATASEAEAETPAAAGPTGAVDEKPPVSIPVVTYPTSDHPEVPLAVRAHLSATTLRRLAALVVVAFMVQLSVTRVGPTMIWAVVGILLAIGLDRPVSWVQHRWNLRRATTVIAGSVLVAALLAGLLSTARLDFGRQGQSESDISTFVESVESLPLVGDQLAQQELELKIADLQRQLPRIVDRSPIAERSVGLAAGGLIALFWIFATALTALVDGPRLVGAASRQIPARFTRQATRLAQAAKAAIAGYVAGSALVAAFNGMLIGITGAVIGAPVPIVLAMWAFSWNFVPQIGAIIGWAPLLVVAFTQGPLVGGVCIVGFVVYQAFENNFLQPAIVGHAVNISALAALGVALLGGAVAGLIGAVLAIPLTGVAHALRTEWNRDDFPGKL